MKKKKLFEVSVINKTYSKPLQDTSKFYTSDSALELGFQLLEVEYTFDSAEILLLNIDDRSFVTRVANKNVDGFVYEIEDDIVDHFGEWKAQLKFEKDGEIYVSSPVIFRIENDLSNDRPPQLTEVNNWKNLRTIADGLIDDLRIELDSLAEQELEIENAETVRQQAESQRQSTFETNETKRQTTFETAEAERQSAELSRIENESQRNLTSVEEFAKLQDAIGGRNLLQKTSSEWENLTMSEADWFTVFGYDENYKVEAGQTYTFSIVVEKINSDDNVPINLHIGLGDTRGLYIYDIRSSRKNDIPMGVKVSSTYTITEDDVASGRIWFAYRLRNEKIATDIRYKEVKLEKGTQATPYTQAPEDYTTVSKEDYYNHVKLMNDFKDAQFKQVKQAVIALGGTI